MSLFSSSSPAPAAGPASEVKEVTAATFMQEVIEASRDAAIVVDFWAPWCGPCKTLGPILEKTVAETKGAVRMVKINIDEPANQQLAAQLRIQSIPTVYAFLDGRPVDMFQGALPESQVKQWIKRIADAVGPTDASLVELLAEAKTALGGNDFETAASLYAAALQSDPTNVEALVGLGRCLLNVGDIEQARAVLAQIPADQAKTPDVVALKTALDLAEQTAGASGETAALQAKLAQNPNDHQARFDLAMALYGAGDKEGAINQLLDLFKRDRNWNDSAARKQLVQFFEALGFTDPLSVAGRKSLSTLMFS
ncbi:thioredoxin [Lacibacterium aquatile]|uniref:Thioredoxin n=1 Tax=Lacibacterium aquatile TaxID=1168082 RepID=A0ABW5DX95_9PROT